MGANSTQAVGLTIFLIAFTLISAGIAGNHFRAQLRGTGFKGILVGLPALAFHVFDGKTNFQFAGFLRWRRLCANGLNENGRQGHQPARGFSQGIFLQIYAEHNMAR